METENRLLNASVSKAFVILDCFTIEKPEWGVRELADHLGANKSTVYRQMASMESAGILMKNEEKGSYRLGMKLFELGSRVDIKRSLIDKTHPILTEVAGEITETVHLGILRNNKVLMMDKVESPQGLKLSSIVGSYSPVYCTGLGKTLLAFQSGNQLSQVVDSLDIIPQTIYTLVDKFQLKCALSEIKIKGFAIDREEYEIGLVCVAVPVFNQNGDCIAAMSAAGPANRFREEALSEYVEILQHGAEKIKCQIGKFEM